MVEVLCPNCRRKLLVAEVDMGAAAECPACHVTFKPEYALDKPSRPDEHVTEQAPYRPPGWDPDDEAYLPPLHLPPPPSQTERVWNTLKQLFRWTFVAGCGLAGLVMLALVRREHHEFLSNLLL